MEKMLNLVLFGPPGAGKGTQSEKLIDKYNLVHLSTGDILRSEIARNTELGRKAKEVMDRGELVSDEIVIGMIESKIDENPRAKGYIFDGFPRTTAQAIALDDLLQKKGTGIAAMLALEVEEEELVKRLLNRGKDSGRSDDQDENIIRRRIEEYNNKTLPLKKYYSEQGKFHSIHGIGTIDEIFQSLVDRITFLNAEMDLTALETDLEHLDLTVKDFEEATDAEPELLLEIDAIKRAEAEEARERRAEARRQKKENTLAGDLLKVAGKVATKVITDKIQGELGREVVIPSLAKAIMKKMASDKQGKKPKTGVKRRATVAAKKTRASASKSRPASKKKTVKKTAAKKVTKKAAKKPAVKKRSVVKKLARPSRKVAKSAVKKKAPGRKVAGKRTTVKSRVKKVSKRR